MAGIEGRSGGIGTVSRSAGVSRGGGFGLAARSIATGRSVGAESGFSSRGFARIKTERPVMSSMQNRTPSGFEAKKSMLTSYGSHFSQESQSLRHTAKTDRMTSLPSRNRSTPPENKPPVAIPRIPFGRTSSEKAFTKDKIKQNVIPDLIGNDKSVSFINKFQPLPEIRKRIGIDQVASKELMTKAVIMVEQSMKPVVGTALESLASLPAERELVEYPKKKNHAFRTEEIQRVGQAYVRAGLAPDVSAGVKMTERFLKIDPTLPAKNPNLEEKVTIFPKRVQIMRPEVAPVHQTQTSQSVFTESSPVAAIKTESVTAAKAKVETQERTIPQTKIEETNQTLKKRKSPISIFDRSAPLLHKLDIAAQETRIKQLKTAVQKIFSAFNYSYRASLHDVAAVLEKPTVQTTSQLIVKLGKKTDGSEVWRDALNSGTKVTGARAMQTGLEAIILNKPVTLGKEGPAVKDEDVQRVLDAEDEEYAWAA